MSFPRGSVFKGLCSTNGYCYLLTYRAENSSIAMESRIFPTLSASLLVFVLWKENYKSKQN